MQQLQKAYRNFIISSGIIVVYTIVIYLIFYPDRSGLGKDFSVAVMYMFTRYAVLPLGIVLLLARIVRLMKSNNGIFYVLIGNMNFLIGVLCVILYSMGQANLPWLNKCLFNLLTGTLILIDVFLWKKVFNPS